jgi:hypothetical protein
VFLLETTPYRLFGALAMAAIGVALVELVHRLSRKR